MTAASGQITDAPDSWADFVHVGPGTLAGRYLRMFWQPVYISKELLAGTATTFHLLDEDFTLYRGADGVAHLLEFRCAHRNTQLNTGWVEGNEIRCFYHGWKYDGSGQCIEQPGEPEPFCNRIKLRSYPIYEYLGFIFAYLGEGEPPPVPHFPDFEEAKNVRMNTYDRNSSYFQSLENTPDNVHVYFVHNRRWYLGSEGWAGLPRIRGEETDWGVAFPMSTIDGEMMDSIVMPNMARRWSTGGFAESVDIETAQRWSDSFAWRVPIDDWSYRSFNLSYSTGGARPDQGEGRRRERQGVRAEDRRPVNEIVQDLLKSRVHIDDYLGHPDATNLQDCVSQNGQGAIVDRSREHLGRSDAGLVMLRKVWARELRLLAEGKPTKQWAPIPARLRDLTLARSGA